MASLEMTKLSTLPTRLLALAMEEYPQPVGTVIALQSENGLCLKAHIICSKIAEDMHEEGTLDEDKTHHFSQESVENLRRCTQTRQWLTYQDFTSIATHSSMDSTESEAA